MSDALSPFLRDVAVAVLIFTVAYFVYRFVFPHPKVGTGHEQDHFIYLAETFLHGSVFLTNLSPEHHDVIFGFNRSIMYNPPAPAFLLMPVVALIGTDFSQAYFGMIVAALNAVLFWMLLRTLGISPKSQALLVPFFAFGTAAFSAATIGSVWYFAHTMAIFFLLLAIICLLRWPMLTVLSGVFLGLAFLSRGQTIMAAPFFLWWIWRKREHRVASAALFSAGLLSGVAFALWYNYARFGDVFDNGYGTIHSYYIHGGFANEYTFLRHKYPNIPHFGAFDARNIPLHLYTLFLMGPDYVGGRAVFQPSPYGLSIFLHSPAFIYAFFARRRDPITRASWLAIVLIAIPVMLYYSQGWVQFGYRFLADLMPFLLILTAFGFDDRSSRWHDRAKIGLVAFSVISGLWGQYWISQLGWGQ